MSYKMPEIDWSKAEVFPKIDGSLIKIYSFKGTWYCSTRGMAFADSKVNGFDLTFKQLVFKALKVDKENDFQWICNEYLEQDLTYIFEITSMENRVVTPYQGYTLWFLAARNKNGNYGNYSSNFSAIENLGAVAVKPYKFDTVEHCIAAAKNLPNLEEGYVVYMEGIPVCKIKSPLYVACHRLRGEGLNPKRIMQLVLANEVDEYLAYFPEDGKHFKPYEYAYSEMKEEIYLTGACIYAKLGSNCSQKDFAIEVKDKIFSSVLFTARKMNRGYDDAFEAQSEAYKLRLLESYVRV